MAQQGDNMQEKECAECGLSKNISEFYKTPKGKYGVMRVCILCSRKKAHADREMQRVSICDPAISKFTTYGFAA